MKEVNKTLFCLKKKLPYGGFFIDFKLIVGYYLTTLEPILTKLWTINMLNIQQYLNEKTQDNSLEKTLISLREDHGIKTSIDPEIDQHLFLLNYNQLESKNTDILAVDCRGIILKKDDFSVVGRAFKRFFNHNEGLEELRVNLSETNLELHRKYDGSIIKVFFDKTANEWKVSSRGSVNCRNTFTSPNKGHVSYLKLVCDALGIDTSKVSPVSSMEELEKYNNGEECDFPLFLDVNRYYYFLSKINEFMNSLNLDDSYLDVNFVFELVSPDIEIITKYEKTELYLLSIVDNDGNDIEDKIKFITDNFGTFFKETEKFYPKSEDEIWNILNKDNIGNSTVNEGFIVYNKQNSNRSKIKNSLYLSILYIKSYGSKNKIFNKIIIEGEETEFLSYYPEYTEEINNAVNRRDAVFKDINELYIKIKKDLEMGVSRKDVSIENKNNIHFKNVMSYIMRNEEYNHPNDIFKQYNEKTLNKLLLS